jgi:hypothetical protein
MSPRRVLPRVYCQGPHERLLTQFPPLQVSPFKNKSTNYFWGPGLFLERDIPFAAHRPRLAALGEKSAQEAQEDKPKGSKFICIYV